VHIEAAHTRATPGTERNAPPGSTVRKTKYLHAKHDSRVLRSVSREARREATRGGFVRDHVFWPWSPAQVGTCLASGWPRARSCSECGVDQRASPASSGTREPSASSSLTATGGSVLNAALRARWRWCWRWELFRSNGGLPTTQPTGHITLTLDPLSFAWCGETLQPASTNPHPGIQSLAVSGALRSSCRKKSHLRRTPEQNQWPATSAFDTVEPRLLILPSPVARRPPWKSTTRAADEKTPETTRAAAAADAAPDALFLNAAR
jgi:hypothetical protein